MGVGMRRISLNRPLEGRDRLPRVAKDGKCGAQLEMEIGAVVAKSLQALEQLQCCLGFTYLDQNLDQIEGGRGPSRNRKPHIGRQKR